MKNPAFTLQQIAYFLIVSTLSVYVLIKLKFILAPLAFAVLLGLLLIPVSNKIEILVKKRGLSAFISLILITLILFFIISMFSYQLLGVFQDIPAISGNLQKGIEQLITWIEKQLGLQFSNKFSDFYKSQGFSWLKKNFTSIWKFFKVGLSFSTEFLFNAFLTFIATFFFLWHRKALKGIILLQFGDNTKNEGKKLLYQIQKVARGYLLGLFTVILILSVLNSLGLWLIGIGHPVFLGSLASILVIIPYIGTTIGGAIPFLYAIATASSWWQPLAVVALIATIQQIEGNLITPNIVGGSVQINFFIAFISIIIGGTIWSIAGVVLALPMVAIIKVICEHISFLKPFSLIMSDELINYEDRFLNEWDKKDFRLSKLFKGKE